MIVAVDLFCGSGGLTRGFLDAGIKVICGFDNDGACKRTYEYNNKIPFFTEDIRKVTGERLLSLVERQEKDLYLLAGCAPCQPFSKRNRKKTSCDERRSLLLEFSRLIEETVPDLVFMENVPMLPVVEKEVFEQFCAVMGHLGYNYKYEVVNAADYGVPQNRNRLVLIGSRLFSVEIPPGEYGTGAMPHRTVADAIAHFPAIKAGEEHPDIPNHRAAGLHDVNLRRLKATPPDGGDRSSWPEELVLECHKKQKGHPDTYGRLFWDKPAPTLTTKFHSISNGRYGHPEQDRAISLREGAALQTFPDDYVFFGSIPNIARQIGNAVPVKMAEAFGKYMVRRL